MVAPIVPVANGDLINIEDHNVIGSYIEQASYDIRTKSLYIGSPGTQVITNGSVLQNITGNITMFDSGTLAVVRGGTGQSSLTKGDLLVGSISTAFTKLAVGSDTLFLRADSSTVSGLAWSAFTELDTNAILKNGTNSPTADIDWDGFGIRDLGSIYPLTSGTNLGNTSNLWNLFGSRLLLGSQQDVTFDWNAGSSLNITIGGGTSIRFAGSATLASLGMGSYDHSVFNPGSITITGTTKIHRYANYTFLSGRVEHLSATVGSRYNVFIEQNAGSGTANINAALGMNGYLHFSGSTTSAIGISWHQGTPSIYNGGDHALTIGTRIGTFLHVNDVRGAFLGTRLSFFTSAVGVGVDTTPYIRGGMVWSTPQTIDSTIFFVDSTSNTLLFTGSANSTVNHAHAAETNPTIFIHSITSPSTDSSQWLSLAHNGSNAIFNTATGNIGLGTSNFVKTVIIDVNGSITSDHLHGSATTNTLYIHSGSSMTTGSDQWLSLTHDGTDSVITSGKGDIVLNPLNSHIVLKKPLLFTDLTTTQNSANITLVPKDGNLVEMTEPGSVATYNYKNGPRRVWICYKQSPYTINAESTAYLGGTHAHHVAELLAAYDDIVLDKELVFQASEFPSGTRLINYTWNASYGTAWKTVIALAKAKNPRLRFFGYIPLGQRAGTDYALTTGEIGSAIQQWCNSSNLDVDGIFFDESGYDFQTTRTIQNYAVDYVRSNFSGPVYMNAWGPGDVLFSTVNATYNPGGSAPSFGGSGQLGGGDTYLLESCPVNRSTTSTAWTYNNGVQNFRATVAGTGTQGFWERMGSSLQGRSSRNVSLCMLNMIPEGPSEDFFVEFAEACAVALSVEGLAISKSDGFDDSQPRSWPLTDWEGLLGTGIYDPNFTRFGSVVATNFWGTNSGFSRYFQRGAISINFDSTLGYLDFQIGHYRRRLSSPPRQPEHSVWKQPVRTVIGSCDITIDVNNYYPEGRINGSQSGVLLQTNDRVLLVNQNTASQNGVYVVTSIVSALASVRRTGDFATGLQNQSGAIIPVTSGSFANANFILTTDNPLTIDTTSLTFKEMSPRVIKSDYTTVANAGTGEDTLFTYTIYPNLMNRNGDYIEFTSGGFFGASLNTKDIKTYYSGSLIFDSSALAITSETDWFIEGKIIRTSGSTQKTIVKFVTSDATVSSAAYTVTNGLMNSTNVLLLTGEGTSNNDIVKETMELKFVPG